MEVMQTLSGVRKDRPNAGAAAPVTGDDAAPWHAAEADAVLTALDTGAHGLSQAEAARRLALHGPNRLPTVQPPGVVQRLARQFNNLLLRVLMASAAVTALLGHWVDAAVIAAVVVLNALIGFVQEGRAEKALQAIRHLLAPHAVVLRGGRQQGKRSACGVLPPRRCPPNNALIDNA